MEINRKQIDSYEIFKNKAGKIVKVVLKYGINTEEYPIEYDKNGNLMRIGAEWVNYGSMSGIMVSGGSGEPSEPGESGDEHEHGNFRLVKILKQPTLEEEGLGLYQCGNTTKNIRIINDETYQWNYDEITHIWSSNTVRVNSSTTKLTFLYNFKQDGVISFDYSVSSEGEDYDYIYYTIYKDEEVYSGGTSTKIGGTSYGNLEDGLTWENISLDAPKGNYKIEFTYRKDGSDSSGDDKGYAIMHNIGEICDYTYTAPIPKLSYKDCFDTIEFTGKNFNEAAKKLVSGSDDTTYTSTDSNITEIKRVYNYDDFPKNKAVALHNSENDSYLLISVKGTTSSWYKDIIYLYSDDDIVILPKDCSYMFYEMEKLSTLNIEYFDSSQTENMSSMFSWIGGTYDKGITSIDLGENFDTSNVTNMNKMFLNTFIPCADDFGFLGEKFNTYNVTDMSDMFRSFSLNPNVYKQITLNNNFDTSNVTNMSGMFYDFCSNYGDRYKQERGGCCLDLGSSFNTLNVTDMSNMFRSMGDCDNLILGDKFNTSNVTNMYCMFYGTFEWSSVTFAEQNEFVFDINFDTSNVTNMSGMFGYFGSNNKEKLVLNLGDKFNTSNVTNMINMFTSFGAGTTNDVILNLGNSFNTTNVITMESMFQNYAITTTNCPLYLGDKFDTSNVTSFYKMFQDCGKNGLTELDLGAKFNNNSVDNSSGTKYRWTIEECGKPPCTIYGNSSIINALQSYSNYAEDTKTYDYIDEEGNVVSAPYHNFVVKYS